MDFDREIESHFQTLVKKGQIDVQELFIKHFENEIDLFSSHMASAHNAWKNWDTNSNVDEREGFCKLLYLSIISLQISSMQQFITGHISSSGNTQRQAFESIATTYLCANNSLQVFDSMKQDKYSTQKSFKHLKKHGESMGVLPEALAFLDEMYNFYSELSHFSFLSRSMLLGPETRSMYIGGYFDNKAMDVYRHEIERKVGISSKLVNILQGIQYVLSRN
ncbi:MAG: hypothetical protein V3T17_17410 [Pseudomonadales bacterium]